MIIFSIPINNINKIIIILQDNIYIFKYRKNIMKKIS